MKRTLFSLVLLLGMVLPAVTEVAAQPTTADQSFVSELTGDEIDLGSSGDIMFIEENYDFRESLSFQEEYIWFTYGWSNFQMVLIAGPNESAEYHDITLGNMEDFYDAWDLIDENVSDETSWFLGEAELDGSNIIVYYEFELDAYGDIDQVVMQFTDITTFQHDLEYVQNEVTVGGDPLLPETDAAELVALTGYETSTPEASPDAGSEDDADTGRTRSDRGGSESPDDSDDVDDQDESDSERSRTSRGGSLESDEDATNESETDGDDSRLGRIGDTLTAPPDDEEAETSTPVSGGDWDELGLISDTEWVSPTYGNSIAWDDTTWMFPTDFEQAIIVNDDPPYDVLTLETVDGLGYVYISVDQAYESTPTSMIDYWTSEDYANQITNGVTVVETGTTANSATLVYETTNAIDQPLTVVLEATFLEDGGIIFSQISAAPESIHEVYEQYVEGVEYDGAPFEMTFTVEDIRDITGN